MDRITDTLLTFFTDPAWLIPTAVSVAAQLVLTHHIKPFLPPQWNDEKRDAVIALLSIAIGIAVFVPTRWAWLTIGGHEFTAAHFVLSAGVALIIIAAMPAIYARLPDTMRRKYSYEHKVTKRLKVVRTADGRYVERPIEQPSGDGEETVVVRTGERT